MNSRILRGLSTLLAVACISGCASGPDQGYQSYLGRRTPQDTTTPFLPGAFKTTGDVSVREIHLSPQDPVDDATQIQLLSVGGDQTTKILTRKGEVLTGRPGDFFQSPDLGASGLQLVTASPALGDALFEVRSRR